jgi:hypothetical protein
MKMEVVTMPGPFPGMDPYLERRNVWRGVHLRLIAAIGDALAPQVAPAYYVDVEEHTYIVEVDEESLSWRERFVGRPDVAIITASEAIEPLREGATATAVASAVQIVTLPLYEEVREGYLEIRDAQTREVVTVIEVLSPSNKTPGERRREYEAKRRQVLATLTNLVEIDLLRAWEPMEMQPPPQSDYRILVRAGWERPQARLYAFSVREVMPEVSIPLRQGEKEVLLSLGKLLSEIYDRARYDLRLDYRLQPIPPLSSDDAAWADALLRSKGLR